MAETNLTPTNNRRHLFIIAITAVMLITLEFIGNLYFVTSTPLERLEFATQDWAFRLGGVRQPNENIIIAAIDDDSLGWIGDRWPWPRSELANIINWLNDAGARLIAIDIYLFGESENPAEDQALAEALANANAVVNVIEILDRESISIGYKSWSMNLPEEMFFEQLDGYGITNVNRAEDAITREIVAIKQVEDETYFNWAIEVARVYLGVEPPSNITLKSMIFNGKEVPLFHGEEFSEFPQSNMLINFAGPAQTYPTYSAAFIPLGDYDKEIFKDKIVFIGATSVSLQDIYPTPFSASKFTPGVEVIANAVDTILSGDYLHIAPPLVTITLILIMAIISWYLVQLPRPTLAIGLMFGGLVLYFILRHIVFIQSGWMVAIVSPMLMLFLGVVVPTLEQAVTQEAEKRRVRGMFSRFISPEMVTQLLDTQDIASLNKRTELTILFSDIRGFTTISERLSPEEVVGLLNPYLEVMSEVIHKHGGTVDKYEGDAIVAFFGEPMPYPDHALRAAKASLEMRQELKILTVGWKAEGRFTDIFEMGIGLNTGEVFVGLLGSEQRINYTVIGDTANLAARLQDQTKEFGFPILVSGETNEQIKSEIKTEFVASRILKGKTEPVQIYRFILPDEGPRMIV